MRFVFNLLPLIPFANSTMSTSELACTYAALILHDDGISITAEKIATLVKASGLAVESYWPSLFAKLASKKNIDDILLNVGSAGGVAAATACAPVSMESPANGAAAAPAAVEKKEEVQEESEDDMVFGLFD